MAERHDFSTIKSAVPIPDLIEVQKRSYARFLQMDLLPSERDDTGLEAVFKSVFPISDFREMSSLDFVEYTIGDWECKCASLKGLFHLRTRCQHCKAPIQSDPKGPARLLCGKCGRMTANNVTFCQKCGDPVSLKLKYDVEECQQRGMTFSAPLKVKIKLTVFEKDGTGGRKSVRDIKEQEVFFGEIPLMTDQGTFIISGTERVVVSQLHRSPGVFFESAKNRTYFLGKIIPYRGSWVEFEYDHKDLLQVRIDRKRKFLGTIFLRALGLKSDKDILSQFYQIDTVEVDELGGLMRPVSPTMLGTSLGEAVYRKGEILGREGDVVSEGLVEDLEAAVGSSLFGTIQLEGRQRVGRKGAKVDPRILERLKAAGCASVAILVERVDERPVSEDLLGATLAAEVLLENQVIGHKGTRVDRAMLGRLSAAGIPTVPTGSEQVEEAFVSEGLLGAVLANDVVGSIVLARRGAKISQRLLKQFEKHGIASVACVSRSVQDHPVSEDLLRRTLARGVEVEGPILKHKGSKVDRRLVQDLRTALGKTLASEVALKGRLLARKGRKITPRLLLQLKEAGIDRLPCQAQHLEGAVFADDLFDLESGEVLKACEANSPVTQGALGEIADKNVRGFSVTFPETDECGTVLSSTLRKDSVKTQDEALLEIYRKLRPGDPPTRETAWALFEGMFFAPQKYDFSRVGRMKFNIKLHGDADVTSLDHRVLTAEDFYATIKYLFKLRRNIGQVDDIDHLGNRRVRAVGELLENQFRIGLIRMERAMKERMTVYQDMTSAMPHDLINAKPVMAAVREFFGSSQLSQFMDQINPLSEITHKRRLSALGPGGLSRERAGFDVRDVHTTHYGRICPIETPEGPNIGLISSLSCFARINEYGFIESPYRRVENGQIVEEVRVTYAGDTSFKPGEVVPLQKAVESNRALQPSYRVADPSDTPLERRAQVSGDVLDDANLATDGCVVIVDPGDSHFAVDDLLLSEEVESVNVELADMVVVTHSGDTALELGRLVSREEVDRANASVAADLEVIDDPGASPLGQDQQAPAVFRRCEPAVSRDARPAVADRIDPEKAEWVTHCDYLSAWEEDKYVIAQANIPVDDNGFIAREFANCRVAGDFQLKRRAEVQYLDVSPKQLVSVAASLIPFLENDDANRALMGSNMQRQAVPLLKADSPIVGTGMERIAARDSGAVVLCKRDGVIDSIDSERIIVRVEDTGHEEELSSEVGADIYQLIKFRRSNQNTCINQKAIVKVGDRVKKGQILADGPCTDNGELALGRNVLVAFMPWRGYNFEDAILVSEKLVKDDYYTSLHVEEFSVDARDTKLGPEEITCDIPNIAEGYLRNLDESGIVRIGATVGPDDILVGKVVPKGDVQLTPEEKLLRAIFGDKAGEVKDASLRCPPGVIGTVVGARVFSRKGVEKDARALAIEADETERLQRNLDDEKRILFDQRAERLEQLMGGQVVRADLHDEKTNRKLVSEGETLGPSHFGRLLGRDLKRLRLGEEIPDLEWGINSIEQMTVRQIQILEKLTNEKIDKLKKGDELPPGVIRSVKVYVAMKRKLSAGDKMAGRHGNKGVIARVLPEEDMPFLPDGTPVEIVLNPLGVPSRMNVGQILETHLGWAGHELGIKYAAPVFEGPGEDLIKQHLEQAGLPPSGKTDLYDGVTGQLFEQEVTVGVIYMLKLSHLVDDKIHARSIGPYSLITQQPLGGKAQFGGQRFGEMEVWALEAYGAAHILQELLTVKSDDVYGRAKIYESIVKGESAMQPGVPESFNVLIRELQSLCLDVELVQSQQDMIETALAAD